MRHGVNSLLPTLVLALSFGRTQAVHTQLRLQLKDGGGKLSETLRTLSLADPRSRSLFSPRTIPRTEERTLCTSLRPCFESACIIRCSRCSNAMVKTTSAMNEIVMA